MFSHLSTFFKNKKSLSVGTVFIVMGMLFGNWATLIPYIKHKFELNDGQLGLLLLSLPFGATIANPIATLLINRFGMRQTTIVGTVVMAIFYTFPVSVDNIVLTAILLVITGMSHSTTNVAMNTCVTAIEQEDHINIMSTCHGMFSTGLMLGSIMASVLIGFKVPAPLHMASIAVLILIATFIIRPYILTIHEEKVEESGSKFALPTGALLLMILISICTNITEGSMADWTAVYMREVVATPDFFMGWGLAGYSLFMAAGRFVGDSLIPKYGTNRILKIGGIVSAVGLAIAILLPYTFTAIFGFALVGAGVSCGAPIMYGSAARIPNMAKGAGLATLNTFSLAGFFIGPAIIGFISKSVGLPVAFVFVGFLGLIWSFLVGRVRLY